MLSDLLGGANTSELQGSQLCRCSLCEKLRAALALHGLKGLRSIQLLVVPHHSASLVAASLGRRVFAVPLRATVALEDPE